MTAAERLAAQRAALRAQEAAAQADLARQYGPAWVRIRARMQTLIEAIAAARAAGIVVDVGWLASQGLLQGLEQTAMVAVRAYVDVANRTISRATAAALISGAVDAEDLARASVPSGLPFDAGLPAAQLTELAASLRPGAPLRVLLDELPFDAAKRARETLVVGLAAGDNPRVIARALRTSMGGNLARALRISRTEILGAYRRAAISRYREHSGVLAGWVWIAELGPRTCAACLALHGTVHPLDEQFASHPNCRCTPAPLTKTWAELGVTDPSVKETRFSVAESGEDWFARQPRAVQLRILGPSKLAAYEDDRISLPDLVQPTLSPIWGHGIRERSLRDALTL